VKTALSIFGFTLLVLAFYSYVGHMVPQKITYPPEATEIGADLTTEEMVTIGEEVVNGKGTCMTCHTIGASGSLRFPDLGQVGGLAVTRKDGLTDIEYLAESLYDPGAFIVEGFVAGMPNIGRPPIALNDQEILTVIAYLQSLGGTPSVTMDTELQWQGQAPAPAAAAPVAGPDGGAEMDGPALMAAYMCGTCHSVDNPAPLVGPSLYDVGSRLSKAEIYEAIMEPDATIAEGFAGGIMPATLQAVGFYDKISTNQLKTMVDHLASLTGG
jgi:mono/diheme cytochrome c family protein